jgi:phospho-N-acetylmuramoyl-pentapeptide-transferase
MWDELLNTGLPPFIAFAATAGCGVGLIPFLRKLKFGQSIKEIGPSWHMNKQGTPTMGGFMFMAGILAAILVCGFQGFRGGDWTPLFLFGFALICGIIGFIDDWNKVKKKQNLGITSIQKLALQMAAAALLLAALRQMGVLQPAVHIPFTDTWIDMHWIAFLTLALLFIGGFVNAVNFTDGIDGLCAGVTFTVAVFFSLITAVAQPGVSLFAGALGGALLGFLLYNFNPARVFMGDTGSLFLGGAVCAMAFAYGRPLVLLPVGIIYLLEIVSVVLQVGYFKLTKRRFGEGKRLFRMSPLHHHFEKLGWSEKRIFWTASGITAVMCGVVYVWG